jgi:branched-chain amino acid aminotransferase
MLIANGAPFRWLQHFERLARGAAFLGIALPYSEEQLRAATAQLVRENRLSNGVLRLTLSRGTGVRGYSPKGADSPFVVMTLHPITAVPNQLQSWKLRISSFHLPANEPLAQFKTCNKLSQILARSHAEQNDADEALLLNTEGFVVEGASSNLFWISQNTVFTPPLASGVLSGVTRLVIFELCQKSGLSVQERNLTGSQLFEMDGVFLSLSTFGIVQGSTLDGRPLKKSPLTEVLNARYLEAVERETAGASPKGQT